MTQKTRNVICLIVFAAIFMILCFGAVEVPNYCIEKFGKTFSQETGCIGDTIGGTVTPYLTIITALLAFVALGFQFISMQQQSLDLKIERMDNKFYNMLDVYQSNANRLTAGNHKGKDAAKELSGELMFIYSLVYTIYEEEYKQLIESHSIDKVLLSKINLFIQSLNEDGVKKRRFLTNIAYGLFYYGWNFTYPYKKDNEEIFRFTEIIKDRLFKIKYTLDEKKEFSEWLKQEAATCNIDEYCSSYPICMGHHDELGCYYRQMYQIVKLVANTDKSVYDEKSKNDHMKILRSQMSDFEQMLLFYNSVSDFGNLWNQSKSDMKKPEDMGYISRFRMIKNIPANVYWRGVFPVDYYRKENQYWNSKGLAMFEMTQMLQVDEA